MSISEKLQTIAENEQRVYNAGYEKGKAEGGNTEEAYNEGYFEAANIFLTYGADSKAKPMKMEYVPNGIALFRNAMFSYCYMEETVVVPESVEKFGSSVFSGAYLVKKIVLHNGVKQMSNGPFTNCTSLEEMIFTNAVTALPSGAFQNCKKLKKITNIGKITSVPTNAFQGATALEYVEFESLNVGTSGVMLNYSNNLTVECMVGIFNSLVDKTGQTGTFTLYLGSTNLAKLTDEQKSIAWNKNITLA
jgi:hypothetical protein